MPLYLCQPPTGYKDTAEAWVNTGALISRMNFAVDLANGRMQGVVPGEAMRRAERTRTPPSPVAARQRLRHDARDHRQGDNAGAGSGAGAGVAGVSASVTVRQSQRHGVTKRPPRARSLPWRRPGPRRRSRAHRGHRSRRPTRPHRHARPIRPPDRHCRRNLVEHSDQHLDEHLEPAWGEVDRDLLGGRLVALGRATGPGPALAGWTTMADS